MTVFKGKKQKQFSAKEKQDYYNKLSKRGATDKNGKPISDFWRGFFHAKAENILNARKNKALKSVNRKRHETQGFEYL